MKELQNFAIIGFLMLCFAIATLLLIFLIVESVLVVFENIYNQEMLAMCVFTLPLQLFFWRIILSKGFTRYITSLL